MFTRRNKVLFRIAVVLLLLFTVSTLCQHALAFGQEADPRLKFQFRNFRVQAVEIEKKASLVTPTGDDYQEIRE
jgi:hypothetical protein